MPPSFVMVEDASSKLLEASEGLSVDQSSQPHHVLLLEGARGIWQFIKCIFTKCTYMLAWQWHTVVVHPNRKGFLVWRTHIIHLLTPHSHTPPLSVCIRYSTRSVNSIAGVWSIWSEEDRENLRRHHWIHQGTDLKAHYINTVPWTWMFSNIHNVYIYIYIYIVGKPSLMRSQWNEDTSIKRTVLLFQMPCLGTFQPIKSGHLTNQDILLSPTSIHYRKFHIVPGILSM